MNKRTSFTVLFLVVVFSNSTYSQWSTDPTINNPICTQSNEQGDPAIISDGSGGAIITWYDDRNGNNDIYAQRINSSGAVLWTLNGLAVCLQAGNQTFPTITSDGNGGAIITWHDSRNDDGDIYAQRIDATGAAVWASDGIPLCTDAGAQYKPAITSDGSSGAIIAWYDFRNHIDDNIFVQRINASGTTLWTTDGIALCTQSNNQRYPTITSDGGGGAIVTWQDERTGSGDPNVYAQKINSNGTEQWTPDGVAVCVQTNFQQEPKIASDGSAGAIIAWHDNRNGNSDIYSQRIDAGGAIVWTGVPNGAAVCTLSSTQVNPAISGDGNGGAIITWTDSRNMINSSVDIFAQKVTSTGITQWVSDVDISTNSQQQNYPAITGDGGNGAIITWYDYRNSNNDIYATKVSSDGSLPAELTTFAAVQNDDQTILVRWATATEVNNYGFDIEKKVISHSSSAIGWSKAGFVEGNGTSNVRNEYSFTDKHLPAGKYLYRLKQIDRDGKYSYSHAVEVEAGPVPNMFALEQNYPNPFNPSTVISYQIPVTSRVSLIVYDEIGRETVRLVNEVKEAGRYSAVFDASKLSTGIYFVRLNNGGQMQLKKMLMIK